MAGDWIKMRTDLYRDPKVCMIADLLADGDSDLARYVNQNMQCDMAVTRNVMRNVTVGALVSVWGVFRRRGKRVGDDLIVSGCSVFVIDDVADIPGFGEAMQAVGWVVQDGERIVLPRFFEEFNVDPSEEKKAQNAERQRRYREKHKEESNALRNVTVASQNNAREEKRREEVNTPQPPTVRLASDDTRFAEQFWPAYPKKVGKPAAEKAWARARINGEFEAVMAALEAQKQSEQWRRDKGQFIPNPATWINQRRWEDEIPGGSQSDGTSSVSDDEYQSWFRGAL